MPIPDDIEKSISLLASVPTNDAMYLLSQLSPGEIATLARYVADHLSVSNENRRDVTLEIFDHCSATPRRDEENEPVHSKDLAIALPFVSQAKPLEPLTELEPDRIYSLIEEELPQTIAAVLHHLPDHLIGGVLRRLPTEKQTEVVKRLASIDVLSDESVADIAAVLLERLARRTQPLQPRTTGSLRIACLLNGSDQATGSALIENLGQEDRQLIHEIQPALLVLRHLGRLRQTAEQRCA